jgi:hypothetical protein
MSSRVEHLRCRSSPFEGLGEPFATVLVVPEKWHPPGYSSALAVAWSTWLRRFGVFPVPPVTNIART